MNRIGKQIIDGVCEAGREHLRQAHERAAAELQECESGRSLLLNPRKGDVINDVANDRAWRVRSVDRAMVCVVETRGETRGLVWYMHVNDYAAAFKQDRITRCDRD
jgi:hypothetical protein